MAFFKGSYYEELPSFTQQAADGFQGPRARPIAAPEAVLEHSVHVGDRLDTLGHHFYANARDWRRLADCNPQALFAEDLIVEPAEFPAKEEPSQRIGKVVLVPRRREGR
ncbi:hypothetical protein [Shimia sp. MMG029]|uniref:hypothetical protein n=1 Tax=Shimia sp. MMG029 TaxID=3021978 RepID=UPI0022FE5EE3|nr:hypothetical protein [Shimia sp. MMG029]MDA5558504.1 hypothetical protein [Shimia sp. MMG029]